jgi:hypothetical protein
MSFSAIVMLPVICNVYLKTSVIGKIKLKFRINIDFYVIVMLGILCWVSVLLA